MTQLETNKKMVVEFYEKAINEKDFDAALKESAVVQFDIPAPLLGQEGWRKAPGW